MAIYYRITYTLQLIAALHLTTALFLPWHSDTGSAADFMSEAVLDYQFPDGIFNTWWFMVFIIPLILISIFRGLSGWFVFQVTGIQEAIGGGIMAVPPMIWFFITFHGGGSLQYGYWLTCSSMLLLLLLIGIEWIMPTKDPRWERTAGFDSNDPETIRQGPHKVCPHCGNPNPPDARRCIFCGFILI